MVRCKTPVLAAVMLLVCRTLAQAQQAPCTAAPDPPDHVDAPVDSAIKASAKSPFTPAVLKLSWKAPDVSRDRAGNAPAGFVIEAGSDRGLSDVAVVQTAASELGFTTSMANGIYYLRVRSVNACGMSRPSKESRVRIENSVEKGQPNPLVILSTVHATRERLGSRAYVRVLGQVRNGWQAAPAPFVQVKATFDGTNGELDVTETTYVNGTTRRLKASRIVTDTVIEPGGAGCFLIFAEFPVGRVTGLGLVASADTFETEPLKGRVELDRPITPSANEFDDLVLAGRMTNVGDRPTRFNELWVEAKDATGQVVDCHAISVHGTNLTLDNDLTTRTGLDRGQVGEFKGTTEAVFSVVRTLRQWLTWDESNDQETPAVTEKYRALKKQLTAVLEGDETSTSSQEIEQARDGVRNEARAIEQGLAAAGRR